MDEGDYDMIDLLAFNCSKLSEELDVNKTVEEHNQILTKYIKNADTDYYTPISDFKEDLDWFNVTEPLSLKTSLQGKIIVLDFFTYCCINCMHILPDLKKLEELYSVEDGLVIIGIHSPKFDNEKDSSSILSAVQRYNITHPVVNDSSSSMWLDLKITCWPTLLILGPRGNPLFVIMGEGCYDRLQKYTDATIQFYKNNGCIKNHALPLNPAIDLIMTSHLKFPGKIVCSKQSVTDSDINEIYALSDTGNHRILIINSNGDVLEKIGGKVAGFIDGSFTNARFNSPQGLTFLNDHIIFVADTINHSIRKINLTTKTVETVAGTGEPGNDRMGGKFGIEQELSSPWDVAIYKTPDMDMSFHIDGQTVPEKDMLFIAMSGLHQIWVLFLDTIIWWKFRKYTSGCVSVIAGNGQEENRNNSYPHNAAFAQPSGLSLSKDNKELYIADSESSCIRKLSLADGKVLPMVGGDRNPLNLFAFGDVDGKQTVAKLQHPLGVAYNEKENIVYVADTYNHKIKKLDISTNTLITYEIYDDTNNIYQFNEPGGLCVNPSGDLLYVADTNNHTIEVINLHTNKIKTLRLNFDKTHENNRKPIENQIVSIKTNRISLNSFGCLIKLLINLNFENSIHLTTDAPQKWDINLSNINWKVKTIHDTIIENQSIIIEVNTVDVILDQMIRQDEEFIIFLFKLNLCTDNICFQKSFRIIFPFSYNSQFTADCISESVTVNIFKDKPIELNST